MRRSIILETIPIFIYIFPPNKLNGHTSSQANHTLWYVLYEHIYIFIYLYIVVDILNYKQLVIKVSLREMEKKVRKWMTYDGMWLL